MKAEQTSAAPAPAPSSSSTGTHVLIFPCPAQGHVNSMLSLAQLLALQNLHVTFLNTEHIQQRLTRFGDLDSLRARYPTLQFKTIPDGLPAEHPRSGEHIVEPLNSVRQHGKPFLRDILVSQKPRISCFIADGYFGGIATDVADEVGIPIIHFRTIGASCIWTYFCVPKLFESNELPIRGEEDMDRVITSIPGMENLLRCRDLPSPCRQSKTEGTPTVPLDSIVFETQQTLRARAVIINTFEDLEAPALSHMRRRFPDIFTVGPLHTHLNSRTPSSNKTTSSNGCLWEVDTTCMSWLDSQPSRSVMYVSFGSITTMTRENLMEIWHGLVNSKRRFLWVVRPDMVEAAQGGDDRVPAELVEGTKERGLMVGWAPQLEVLNHKAVGGFMTHCGWNSTIESVAAGVPMIGWPSFVDQQLNSRLVSEFWKVGLDMKDVCDRNVVEKMVNDVLVYRRDEFLQSAHRLAALANESVTQGGSSYSNLDSLVHFINSIGQVDPLSY